MDVLILLERRDQVLVARQVREDAQLDLRIVGDDELLSRRRDESPPDLPPRGGPDRDVLEVRVSHGFRLLEFLAVIITGAIGGGLLWLGATQLFPQPIAKMELYTVFGVPLFMALFFWPSWLSPEFRVAGRTIRIANGGGAPQAGSSPRRLDGW